MKKIVTILFAFSSLHQVFANTSEPPLQEHSCSQLLESYFSQLPKLVKDENWNAIVLLGEKVLVYCQEQQDYKREFSITDQLVSTYFRQGNFMKAREKADRLMEISQMTGDPIQVINSFYKLAAVLRGVAATFDEGSYTQKDLFNESRQLLMVSLQKLYEECPNNASLKGKILFNAGAVEVDDPSGNHKRGYEMLQDAYKIFSLYNENDYKQRTVIRLATLHLVENHLEESLVLLHSIENEPMETRTKMHLQYLQARLSHAKGLKEEAIAQAKEGQLIARQLKAEADASRFEKFLQSL